MGDISELMPASIDGKGKGAVEYSSQTISMKSNLQNFQPLWTTTYFCEIKENDDVLGCCKSVNLLQVSDICFQFLSSSCYSGNWSSTHVETTLGIVLFWKDATVSNLDDNRDHDFGQVKEWRSGLRG